MTDQTVNNNNNNNNNNNENIFSSLDAEAKAFVDNKGFKNIGDVVNGYRNLEKFQGVPQEKLLKIPDDNADASIIDDFYTKLGRPKTANDYKFDIKDGQDDSLAKAIAPELHKVGISQKQANALYNALVSAKAQELKIKEEAQQRQIDELKAEWGNNYDTNLNNARKAARIVGVKAEDIDALEKSVGYKTVMNIFNNIASKFSEDTLKSADIVGGDGSKRFSYSSQEARQRIEELKTNKDWLAKFNSGDKAAIREYQELSQIAYR